MTVVFLTFHGVSHFNASFRIARLLSKTYTPIYAGFPLFRNYVEGQGFKFYPLESVPFGLGFEGWVNEREKTKSTWFGSLRDRWNGRLFSHRDKEIRRLVDDLHPTCIFIDAQQPTDFVVLYPYAKARRIKIVILHTMLPHVLRRGYPPGNSLIGPRQSIVAFATLAYRCRRSFRKMVSLVKFLGKTNESMIRSKMKANGTPLSYLSTSVSHLSVHITGPDEFILSPEEFDFSSPARSARELYVGFLPDNLRREFVSETVVTLLSHVERAKLPLVYCSLGTVSGSDMKLVDDFLKRFTEAVATLPVVAAISTMARGQLNSQTQLPSNVYVFNPAPQLTLLGKASVFITHGGINSIKESIYAGVPMLVYARDPRLDQNGNAARIKFNKLGLTGDIRRDSVAGIASKINELMQNPEYRTNVFEFKSLDSLYDDNRFLELFSRVAPLD